MKRLFSLLGRKSLGRKSSTTETGTSGPAGTDKAYDKSVGQSSGETSTFLTGVDATDARNLRLLLDTMAELISDQELEHLVRKIVDRAIKAVRAERGILFLAETEAELKVSVARDAAGNDLAEDFRYSTTVIRRVHQDGEGLCLRVGDSDHPEDLSASVVDLKLRAVMCVRLRFQDKVLGVIYVDSRVTNREFTTKDLRYFDALSVALSIALENARLVQEALERERLQRSLEIARQIQAGLFPKDYPDLCGVEIAGRSEPAEVAAGDYYDFFRRDDGRLTLVIGDVTGHGVGPALVMAGARAALRALCAGSYSESQILTRLNVLLSADLSEDMFMTLLLCGLDLDTKRLCFCNAGQSAPLILRASGEACFLAGTGLALGIESQVTYQNQETVGLEPGDLLLLYTDGLFEARRDNGETFGRERIVETLGRHRSLPAQQILNELCKEVERFTERPKLEDDLTLVLVKIPQAS